MLSDRSGCHANPSSRFPCSSCPRSKVQLSPSQCAVPILAPSFGPPLRKIGCHSPLGSGLSPPSHHVSDMLIWNPDLIDLPSSMIDYFPCRVAIWRDGLGRFIPRSAPQ